MKSLIFLSLYVLVGAVGWGVYHYALVDNGAASAELAQMIPKTLDFGNNAGPKSLYRWQDESGKWQYSNTRPKEMDAKVQEQMAGYIDEMNALKALPIVASELAKRQEEAPLAPVVEKGWVQKATGTVRNFLPGSG